MSSQCLLPDGIVHKGWNFVHRGVHIAWATVSPQCMRTEDIIVIIIVARQDCLPTPREPCAPSLTPQGSGGHCCYLPTEGSVAKSAPAAKLHTHAPGCSPPQGRSAWLPAPGHSAGQGRCVGLLAGPGAPGVLQKCRFSGPTPSLLNARLGARPPGDLSMRTQV